MKTDTVSWNRYAEKYDMLMAYNPFYQSLFNEVLGKTDDWQINKGDIIIDIGAGTGNYSCALAEKFPQASIIHIDNDEGMNRVTLAKKEDRELENIQIKKIDMNQLEFDANSIKAFTCIHSLYTLQNPLTLLKKIHSWLVPGGYGVIVDPGRKVNVLDWQLAIGYRLIRNHGLPKTLKILKEGKEVSKQNKAISKLQDQGIYWTHTHQQFCDAVQNASFKIVEKGVTFRKISDLAVVTK